MGRRHAGRIWTGWSFWVKLRRSLVQIVPGEKAKKGEKCCTCFQTPEDWGFAHVGSRRGAIGGCH
jgi:hypothetical protein